MVLGDDLINNLMMDIHDLLYRCLLCTKGCYSPSTMIVLFPSVGHVFTFFFQLPVWMAIAEDSPKNYRKWCFGIPESDELIGGSDLVWAMSDLLFQRSRTKESRFFKLSRSLKGVGLRNSKRVESKILIDHISHIYCLPSFGIFLTFKTVAISHSTYFEFHDPNSIFS